VIPDNTDTFGWRASSITDVEPRPKHNEVVSFTHFHNFGFRLPAHPLIRSLLHYYGLRLHDLTLDGRLHLFVSIMLCEGFLGVPAHLWAVVVFILGGSFIARG
jgi:hypothetical protein